LGIVGGVIVLLAIVYVPILFDYAGYSQQFEFLVRVARWPLLALLVLGLLAVAVPLRPMSPCREVAVGQRGLGIRHLGLAARFGRLFVLRRELRPL
jgi:uncharacterized membrane protein